MEFTYSFSPEPVRCNFQEKKAGDTFLLFCRERHLEERTNKLFLMILPQRKLN